MRTARLNDVRFQSGVPKSLFRSRRLGPIGEYGGSRKPRAASQSKGKLAEIEGYSKGDLEIGYDMRVVLGVMGRAGAEVEEVEVEALIRRLVEEEDRFGDAMAFAWARRRRSMGQPVGQSKYAGAGPDERRTRTRTSRLSRVLSRVTPLSENYFLWELDVPFRRDAWPRCIVSAWYFLFVHRYVIYTKDPKWKYGQCIFKVVLFGF